MTEATWGEGAATPKIDWRMSAALQNVPRGEEDLAEVTSLEGAVRAWSQLDREHQEEAVITPDHSILIDGVTHTSFTKDGIADLARRLSEEGARTESGDPDAA
jgi:hypothetical protein